MLQKSVVCVLVNWNHATETVACVRSLATQNYEALKVIVVDNASTDTSVEEITRFCPQVHTIEAKDNHGFAAGCNVGIRVALELNADYVWLLNNDTIVPSDTLLLLLQRAECDEKNGIVGSVLRYLDNPETIQAWGGGSITPWLGYGKHFKEPTVFKENTFLTFASVLIRCELFTNIGLLDDRFFMYYEDADFCFRARNAGWQLDVAPATAILHKEGGSTSPKTEVKRTRASTASGLHFLSKHGSPQRVAMCLFAFSRVAKRVMKLDLAGIGAVLKGIVDFTTRS